MDTYVVVGPHGAFEACATTGRILTPRARRPVLYRAYSAIDAEEFRAWCAKNGVAHLREAPILCVGLHRFDGRYEKPEEVFREEWTNSLGCEPRTELA